MMSSAAVAGAHAGCGVVTITKMNWASGQVVTAVAKFLMEQGYGCKVTAVPSATTTAIASLAETGKPDIVTELWVNSTPSYAKLEAAGKVKTATEVLSDGGVEAWWIPDYLAKKHPELKTIQGVMSNPDKVGGKFHNCPDGWACRKINDNVIKALKMSGKVEIFNHGSGETLAASLAAAYEAKKPWFGYYWAPTAVLGKYPMVQVSVGDYKAKIHSCNGKGKDCGSPGVSAYPKGKVITTMTSDLATRAPAVFELMKKVSFTNDQMGKVLAWKKDNKASADEAAAYFLKTYKGVWGAWLNDDARKKLAALLK
ncbi:MAG: glycine betaine ABC transporter substrate-binding protein [Pseudomonadota bacterium]